MSYLPKANDVLEVVEDKENGLYKVYSYNDECIYTMKRADIQHEELLGAEIIWEVDYVLSTCNALDLDDGEVLRYA